MDRAPITIAETAPFIRKATKLLTAEELDDFRLYIALNPEAGDIIPETGGIRKVRWGRQASGKRGGVRVIYFYYNASLPLYLITLYAKAERENISPDEKHAMTQLVAMLKRQMKR